MHTHIQTHIKTCTQSHCSIQVIFFPSVITSLSSVNQFSLHCRRCCPLSLPPSESLPPSLCLFSFTMKVVPPSCKVSAAQWQLVKELWVEGLVITDQRVAARDHTQPFTHTNKYNTRAHTHKTMCLCETHTTQNPSLPSSLISYPWCDYSVVGGQYFCQQGDIIL